MTTLNQKAIQKGGKYHSTAGPQVDTRADLKKELKVWEEKELDYDEIESTMALMPTRALVKFFLKNASESQLKKMVKEWKARKETKRLYHLAKQLKKNGRTLDGFDIEKTIKKYKPTIWGLQNNRA